MWSNLKKWKIGNIEIKNQIVLAPMAGVSTPSFMKICEEMGVGYVVTELISSEALVRDNKKTLEMLDGLEDLNIPLAVQLFGNDKDVMAKAAKIVCNYVHKKIIIDINMGCPVPKVAIKAKSGSALLKDPDKVRDIVESVKNAVDVPVTVKIRSGWDENHINACEIAKICEEAGASAIAIHARTRSQGYSGKADWDIIKDVKKSVSIPVIGNGDVKTPEDAKKMLDETGCDAVMIGRGALGNPWLIKECIEYLDTGKVMTKPNLDDKINMIKKHFSLLKSSKNEKLALLEIRSHVMWYLKGEPNSAKVKSEICKCKSTEEIFSVLDKYQKENKSNIQNV